MTNNKTVMFDATLSSMTLYEFCEKRARQLEKFKLYWLASHEEDPENWPLKFGGSAQAEWDAQFDAWVSLEGANNV